MIVFMIPIVVMLIVYFFMLIETQWRCSYCGKFFFRSTSWHRRGLHLHMENIVNECNGCHSENTAEKIRKKGWAKIENKSDGPLSWTEYTDHNGYVYTMYDMMINPATPGAYMRADVEEKDEHELASKECKHELVSTEYSSQPYGHCLECDRTVFRDEDNNWKL